MLAEAALDVPTLVIKGMGKVLAESSSRRRLRPAPPCISSVQDNDAELVAAEAMIVFGVVARIGQNRAQSDECSGLAHSGREVGRVLARTDAGDRTDDQARVDVENRGESWDRLVGDGQHRCRAVCRSAHSHAGFKAGRIHRGDR